MCVDDTKSLQNPETRHKIFQEHGRFVSSLRGCYQLAEDIGATVQDMVNFLLLKFFIFLFLFLKKKKKFSFILLILG